MSTLGNIGELELRAGDLANAKAQFLAQLELGRKIPGEKQVAYGLHGLGPAMTLEGDTAGARVKLEEAISIRKRLGQTGLVAESDLLLGRTLTEESQCEKAEGILRSAASEFEREDERDLELLAKSLLAKCMVRSGSGSTAARFIEPLLKNAPTIEGMATRVAVLANQPR